MRDWSNILNHCYLKTCSLQCTDCSFTTLTGTLYIYFNILHAVFHCNLCSGFSGRLSSVRSALAGTAEIQSARAAPGNGVALGIGNGDDGVVKRALDMRVLRAALAFVAAISVPPYFFLLATVRFGPLQVRALVLVRWPRQGRLLR